MSRHESNAVIAVASHRSLAAALGMRPHALVSLALICLLTGGFLFGHAGWLQAKAWLAQYLIEDAWSRTLAGERKVQPWPWADTWPVARLTTPDGNRLYVLEGLTGHALAFGPARLSTSRTAGQAGSMVIAGHKDSHFRFLQHLERDQVLQVQTRDGRQYHYRVTNLRVADSRTQRIPMHSRRDELILITCYPFGPGRHDSPLRHVVTAVRT